jgi:hypothetical protein
VVAAYATPRKIGKWVGLGGFGWVWWIYPREVTIITGTLLGVVACWFLIFYVVNALVTNSWRGPNSDDDIDWF